MTLPSSSARLTPGTYDRRRTPSASSPRQVLTLLHSRATRAMAIVPASVSASSWQSFVQQVDVARYGGPLASVTLRQAVRSVVVEMRAAAASWDAVYLALGSAVAEAPAGEIEYTSETHMHANRGAALVAHMHAWADCARLDELESKGGE